MSGLARIRSVQRLVSQMSLGPRLISARVVQPPKMCRFVGTSGPQKSETAAVSSKVTDEVACKPAKKEFWVSYGYCNDDKHLDRHMMNVTFFVIVSVLFCGGSFLLAYLPDFRDRDWYMREAYLQLRYREQNGLPLIDPNLIDPAKIKLPTDEELGDREIII